MPETATIIFPKRVIAATRTNPKQKRDWRDSTKPACIAQSSGELIRTKKPALYRKVVKMLASPEYSFADISRSTKLSWPTIRAIYHAQSATIEEQRKYLAKKIERTTRQLVDRVSETASYMKPRDAIFGVSVLANQWALLTGSATSHNLNVNLDAKPIDIAGQFEKLHAAIEAKSTPSETLSRETKTPES
jgi:hypothetical protein